MKTHIYMITLFVSILCLSSCVKDMEETNSSEDILKVFTSQMQDETQLINFGSESRETKFLLRGWDSPEPKHTWANAKESQMLFYSYDSRGNKKIEITCFAVPTKDNKKQIIDVILNDRNIGLFIAEPYKYTTVEFNLHASALRCGENILQFNYTYTEKPMNVDEGSEDSRDLSVAFVKILFKNNKSLKYSETKKLLQSADSEFHILRELPTRFDLNIHYKNVKGAISYLELIDEANERIKLKLPIDKKKYRQTVELSHEGIFQISFVTEGPNGSYTVWKEARLRIHEEDGERQLEKSSSVSRPDIFLYVVDTLRADHLGCYGYKRNTSPNIDSFAKENSLYKNAYSNTSWTRASCASILTGLFPKNHKTMSRDSALPDDLITLSEILRKHGYYTAAYVTNENICDVFGFDQGFDEFSYLAGKIIHVLSDELNDKVFGFLNNYMDKEKRKPLFMLIWSSDPHDPYTPPENLKQMFGINQYAYIDTYPNTFLRDIKTGTIRPEMSQIEYIKVRYDQEIFFNDIHFGKLLEKLKELEIYDESIVLFSADHGEEFFEHDGVGHGLTLYNEVIKIPFIIRAKGIEKREYEERILLSDIYPTLLDILGISKPYELDGSSLLRKPKTLRPLYFEERLDGNDSTAVLYKHKKLIFNRIYHRPPLNKAIPIIELNQVDDMFERRDMNLNGFEDAMLLQKLFYYMNSKGKFQVEPQKADIPIQIDQRLKEMGYVR